jgi:hypothetical protein
VTTSNIDRGGRSAGRDALIDVAARGTVAIYRYWPVVTTFSTFRCGAVVWPTKDLM